MKALLAMTVAFLAAGCNGEVEPQAEVNGDETESVFDPMTEQIDNAKKVEVQAMQHKDDLDAALKDAEGEH